MPHARQFHSNIYLRKRKAGKRSPKHTGKRVPTQCIDNTVLQDFIPLECQVGFWPRWQHCPLQCDGREREKQKRTAFRQKCIFCLCPSNRAPRRPRVTHHLGNDIRICQTGWHRGRPNNQITQPVGPTRLPFARFWRCESHMRIQFFKVKSDAH